ncbi:uncharacterized protein LOC129754031 [Uranotaenia lowii]|uniref:uncharacterized protein LOC129754031 n=1 Tax=Uranotaenia lowii TaxID=190385 RepID=UPI00247B1764|nr:uncharacterized protein LOC129754031 [Uranotaenia lowii]
MFSYYKLSLFTLIIPEVLLNRISFVPSDEFEDCGNGKPLGAVDMSQLEIIRRDEDGMMFLNGQFKFLEEYDSPIRIHFRTMRRERGRWNNAIASRLILDFCTAMKDPMEPWYNISSAFKNNKCPFKAGSVEEFNMKELGQLGKRVPVMFAGEWRLYMEVSSKRNGAMVEECLLMPVNLVEVN